MIAVESLTTKTFAGRPFAESGKMKSSKLLAMLALAGLCGATETQARSHKSEVKRLEKERAASLEAHREARERLDELTSKPSLAVETADTFHDEIVSTHQHWTLQKDLPNVNWPTNSELSREREREEARMREAAREIERIDKAIKQKAGERRR